MGARWLCPSAGACHGAATVKCARANGRELTARVRGDERVWGRFGEICGACGMTTINVLLQPERIRALTPARCAQAGTLADLLTRQEINPHGRLYSRSEALAWCMDIAAGLHAIHSRPCPIIHRDIKLENILLRKATDTSRASKGARSVRTTAVLADFGLAVQVRPAWARSALFALLDVSQLLAVPGVACHLTLLLVACRSVKVEASRRRTPSSGMAGTRSREEQRRMTRAGALLSRCGVQAATMTAMMMTAMTKPARLATRKPQPLPTAARTTTEWSTA